MILSDLCNSLHMFVPFETHIKVARVWKQSMLDTNTLLSAAPFTLIAKLSAREMFYEHTHLNQK